MPTPHIENKTAVAEAALKKDSATPPPPGSPEAAAAAIRTKMQEGGPRSATELMQKQRDAEQRAEIDAAKSQQKIEGNSGTDLDPTSAKKVRTGDTETRYKKMTQYESESRKLLSEGGFDSLTPAEKTHVLKSFERQLKAFPDGLAIYSALRTQREKEAFVKSFLEEGGCLDKIKAQYDEAMATEIPDNVTEKKREYEAKKRLEDAKQKEIKKNRDRRNEENNAWLAGGVKAGAYNAIDAPTIQTELESFRKDKVKTTGAIKDLEIEKEIELHKRPVDRVQVNRLVTDLAKKRLEDADIDLLIAHRQGELQKKQQLQQDYNTLGDRLAALDEEQEKLKDEKEALQKDRLGAQADYEQQKLIRAAAERKFAQDLEKVIGKAVGEQLEENIKKAEEAQKAVIEAEKKQTNDEIKKALLDKFLTRWKQNKEVGFFNKRTVKELDANQANADFETLLKDGPDAVLRKMLTDTGNKDKTVSGLTSDEVDSLMNDEAFVKEFSPQIAERALAARFRTGKQIHEADAIVIAESEWGKDMIENAINHNQELKAEIDKLKSQGLISGKALDAFRSKGKLGLLLMILFGVVTVGTVPAITAMRSASKNSFGLGT